MGISLLLLNLISKGEFDLEGLHLFIHQSLNPSFHYPLQLFGLSSPRAELQLAPDSHILLVSMHTKSLLKDGSLPITLQPGYLWLRSRNSCPADQDR